MLDAYTVRKAIPRLLLAVIAINLSIYLCIAALDITMVIGHGLNQLLAAPFINEKSFEGVNIPADTTNNITGVLASGTAMGALTIGLYGAVGAASASIISVLGLILPLIITVVLITLAVLFTLVIRQGLLIFLVVTSPIAFVLYVLPGTEKFFKQWGDLFIRTLAVYPIIAAIFAMCNGMAAILLNTAAGQGGASMIPASQVFAQQSGPIGTLQILTAIMVLYMPLVLIPFSFKLAGGAIGAIANAANSRATNLAGRAGEAIRKSRADQSSFLGHNRFKALQNRRDRQATAGQLAAGSKAFVGGGIRGVRNGHGIKGTFKTATGAYSAKARSMSNPSMYAEASQFMENNEAFNAFKGDDDVLWASMRATDAAGIRKALQDRVPDRFSNERELEASTQAILRAQSMVGAQTFSVAATRAQAKTGTGFNYGNADDDMMKAIHSSAGNDGALAGQMLAEMRTSSMQAGRVDLGGSGYGQHIKAYNDYVSGEKTLGAASSAVKADVVKSQAGTVLQGKWKSTENLAPEMKQALNGTLSKPGEAGAHDFAIELANLANKYDASRSAAPNNANVFSKGVMSQNIDTTILDDDKKAILGIKAGEDLGNITYQEAIERARSNRIFTAQRQEFASRGPMTTSEKAEAQKQAEANALEAQGLAGGSRPPGGPPPPNIG